MKDDRTPSELGAGPSTSPDAGSIEFIVIVVEPKYQGNIGSIARLCRNFGIKRMVLVNPPALEDEAYAYSMHGRELLERAVTVRSFDEAAVMVDLMVGTSGVMDSGEKNYQRNPLTPEQLVRWSRGVTGRIGLAFGREDFGLLRTELEKCDLLVTIPADPAYPVLNLSHAASVLLYELWKGSGGTRMRLARSIDIEERKALLRHYDMLMEISGVQDFKKPIWRTNFRRLMARASPNYREFYSLMGTFTRAMDYKRERSPFRTGKENEDGPSS